MPHAPLLAAPLLMAVSVPVRRDPTVQRTQARAPHTPNPAFIYQSPEYPSPAISTPSASLQTHDQLQQALLANSPIQVFIPRQTFESLISKAPTFFIAPQPTKKNPHPQKTFQSPESDPEITPLTNLAWVHHIWTIRVGTPTPCHQNFQKISPSETPDLFRFDIPAKKLPQLCLLPGSSPNPAHNTVGPEIFDLDTPELIDILLTAALTHRTLSIALPTAYGPTPKNWPLPCAPVRRTPSGQIRDYNPWRVLFEFVSPSLAIKLPAKGTPHA